MFELFSSLEDLRELVSSTISSLLINIIIWIQVYVGLITQPFGLPREFIGRQLLKFSFFRKIYRKECRKQWIKFSQEVTKKRNNYPPAFIKIPEHGLSYDLCMKLINSYTNIVSDSIRSKYFSGTIYSTNLQSDNTYHPITPNPNNSVEDLCTKIYRRSHLWNSLHDDEFPIATYIEQQAVCMAADLMGNEDSKKIMGAVTTGGTQSIMTAARGYMRYGMEVKGLLRSNCVIIAPKTIHASLIKAANAYGFCLELVDVFPNGKINMTDLLVKTNANQGNIVAFFCSIPSYPYGNIDDVNGFAELALREKAGLHVDACLGGFIINFHKSNIQPLRIKGVTSLSIDTHKNGLASKGNGVLITLDLFGENLMYFTGYTVEGWLGGLYGTPGDEGSRSCVPAFCAMITMAHIGKTQYALMAKQILLTGASIRKFLSFRYHVDLIEDPNGHLENVIAFKLTYPFRQGATYALADEMKKQGIVLNTLSNGIVHFCVTNRTASDSQFIEKFKNVFIAAENLIMKLNMIPDHKFDEGTARLYCSVDLAMKPDLSSMTVTKYVENWLFGLSGTKDAIRRHFMAQFNPTYDMGLD